MAPRYGTFTIGNSTMTLQQLKLRYRWRNVFKHHHQWVVVEPLPAEHEFATDARNLIYPNYLMTFRCTKCHKLTVGEEQ